jgi:hypothetical protein
MKIAVINKNSGSALSGEARHFLPKLLTGLLEKDNEIHLIADALPEEETFRARSEADENLHINLWNAGALARETGVPLLVRQLGEFKPDVYLIWDSEETGWAVLPLLPPEIATLAVGHADSEIYYAPVRHYRSFLTRLIGVTPEVSVGFVLNCVVDKERVEWISYGELEGSTAETAEEELQKVIETYLRCFEKAIADAHAAPRAAATDFPPLNASRSESPSWFSKLKAKIMN